MPRWLFEYLGVKPSNVETVEVAGGKITVELCQPVADWDAFMRATSLLHDTVERIRTDFGLSSEDIAFAMRNAADSEEWMQRAVQQWVARRQQGDTAPTGVAPDRRCRDDRNPTCGRVVSVSPNVKG
jgi:hypothetical protein